MIIITQYVRGCLRWNTLDFGWKHRWASKESLIFCGFTKKVIRQFSIMHLKVFLILFLNKCNFLVKHDTWKSSISFTWVSRQDRVDCPRLCFINFLVIFLLMLNINWNNVYTNTYWMQFMPIMSRGVLLLFRFLRNLIPWVYPKFSSRWYPDVSLIYINLFIVNFCQFERILGIIGLKNR